IRADDRRVPARVAQADPPLLQDRYVGDAVHFCEVMRGRKPVSASADDDHIVAGLGRRIAPGRFPSSMTGESLSQQTEDRVTHGSGVSPPQKGNRRSTARIVSGPASETAASPAGRHAALAIRIETSEFGYRITSLSPAPHIVGRWCRRPLLAT